MAFLYPSTRASGQEPEYDSTDLEKNLKEARLSRRNTPVPSAGAIPLQQVESTASSYQSTEIGPLHYDQGDRQAGNDDFGLDIDPQFDIDFAASQARTAELTKETDRLLGREASNPETGQHHVSHDEEIQQQAEDQLTSDIRLSHQPEPSTPHHHRVHQPRLETPQPKRPEELTAVQKFEEQVAPNSILQFLIEQQLKKEIKRATTPIPGLGLTTYQVSTVLNALH